MLGSTPALVNPTLAVGISTSGSSSTTATALERELGGPDGKHCCPPAKVSSRSVHGDLLFFRRSFIVDEHINSLMPIIRPPGLDLRSRPKGLCFTVGAIFFNGVRIAP